MGLRNGSTANGGVVASRRGRRGVVLLIVAAVMVASHLLLLRTHHRATSISSTVLLADTLKEFISPQLPESILGAVVQGSNKSNQTSIPQSTGDQTPPNETKNANNNNIWDESTILPNWMKDYSVWHERQRRSMRPDNWKNYKYLVMQCLTHDRCGGTADRLKPVPMILWMAHRHERILFIRWQRPAKLESFLLPPEGGIDWRVPDWLEPQLGRHPFATSLASLQSQLKQDPLIVRSKYQSGNAGQPYYDEHAPGPKFTEIYHDTWRMLFTPVPPLAALIQQTQKRLGLTPGNYAAAHLRALYARESRHVDQIQEWATNAVQCASQLRPGGPIYFASDSKHAVDVIQHYAASHNRSVVSLIHEKEPLHLEKAQNWTSLQPSDFYDTFVDLYLLGMSRCLTHNIGGFGQWALMLGYNASCGMRHAERQDIVPCEWKDADALHPVLPHNDSSLRSPMSDSTR